MNRAGPSLLATLSLLAGCASGRHTPRPDIHLPVAFEAPRDITRPGAPLERWWSAYDDPQLEQLIRQALADAPDARSARARLDEAVAVRGGALAAYWPQGGLQGSAVKTASHLLSGPSAIFIPGAGPVSLDNSGTTNSYSADFSVSWEIDLFGRARAARGKANADLAAARFDYEATRTSLAANVADQLFQARGLAIQLEDAREEQRIQRGLADIARRRAVHGVGSTADAEQTAALVAQADARVADLASQLHVARRILLVLVGQGVDPLDSLPTPAEAGTPPAVPTTAPGELLARRPDVREAAEAVASALGQLKLDQLALLPRLTLNPELGISAGPGFGGPASSEFWSIGLGLTQPILDLPRLKSKIRAQGARADQAIIAYEKAVQTAYGEAENALVALSADEARVALLTTGEAEAQSAYRGARANYAAGVEDLTSTLQAERTWRNARTALTGARVQALRRSVQAFKALGGGWSPAPTA
ncbi:MAG: efflux system, outer rane lipoprotein NodT family [Caulobacteraceae bacterium]|nr:efflux system, outer rane lipoprotein NodT family [Caulobacteraceae bacterium]